MKTIIKTALIIVVSSVLTMNAFSAESSGEKKVKPYKLDICPVSGEKLGGSMGKPHVITYKDREIKFCCAGCENTFRKSPEKYIKKIEEAEKAKSAK